MENPEIPGRIQMERFIPEGIFRKKVIPFEVLPFSNFTETTKIFCTICLDYWCQASCQEKAKTLPVFCITAATQTRPCFRYQKKKKYRNHLTEIFQRNFRAHYVEEEAPKMDNDVNRLITKNIPHNTKPKEKLQKSLN